MNLGTIFKRLLFSLLLPYLIYFGACLWFVLNPLLFVSMDGKLVYGFLSYQVFGMPLFQSILLSIFGRRNILVTLGRYFLFIILNLWGYVAALYIVSGQKMQTGFSLIFFGLYFFSVVVIEILIIWLINVLGKKK